MKPFSLERAKAGDRVYHTTSKACIYQVDFIGMTKSGWAIIECGGAIDRVKTMDLRMAPKKVTRWVNVYAPKDGGVYGDAAHYSTEAEAKHIAVCQQSCSVQPIAVAVPIEYEV